MLPRVSGCDVGGAFPPGGVEQPARRILSVQHGAESIGCPAWGDRGKDIRGPELQSLPRGPCEICA